MEICLPESYGIVVWPDGFNDAGAAMSSGDITNDITMELPLILLSIKGHVIGIDEIPCYLINCEGLG